MMGADMWIESIIRAFMCLAGILGNNWLAIRSVPGPKLPVRTNEVFFMNLAISNLITNYLVDLPDTMADFARRWFFGETYCGIFKFLADLSKTSSIFSTFFISMFWYQKLVGSLKHGGAPVQLDSLHLVVYLLGCSWTVAVVFSIPHFFFVTVEGGNISHEACVDVFPNQFARQAYETLYLTLANAIPLLGIVYASARIVITLLQNQKRIQGHNSEIIKDRPEDENTEANKTICSGALPNPKSKSSKESSTQARAAKSVVAVASVFLVCWLTHLLLRISTNIQASSIVVDVASYVAASYTSIIPYIFLYGVKKLSCPCRGLVFV